jgi:carotenoid cleavage dioxygenase-like enzyme
MSNISRGNGFLKGPFAPTRQDGRWDDLEIIGEIPQELCGTLYRTGSEPQFDPVRADLYHWFDGDGVIGGITLKDGRASFQRRVVDTAGLAVETQAGHAIYGGLNGGGLPQKPQNAPPVKNTANTNVTVFGDKLLAFMEMGLPHELKKDDLQTIGCFDFGGIKTPVTAHWKVDPDNGDLLFYGVFMTQITWYRANRLGEVIESHAFDMGVPSFIHDFAVTKDFAIFFINPTITDIPGMMRGERPVIWAPEVGCRIALLNRHTFALKMIATSEPFAPTHFLNAWQDGDDIVIDGNRTSEFGYPRGVPVSQFDHLWFKTAYPWRWRINPTLGTLRDEQISDINSEFPRHNESLVGKPVLCGNPKRAIL